MNERRRLFDTLLPAFCPPGATGSRAQLEDDFAPLFDGRMDSREHRAWLLQKYAEKVPA